MDIDWRPRLPSRCPPFQESVHGGRRVDYVFEWDPAKASANARKHGVTFDEASSTFADPLAMLIPDHDHSEGEERYLLLGMSVRERLLVVALSERPPRTRLVSARQATQLERRRYEAQG